MPSNLFSTPWMVLRKGDKPGQKAISAHPGAVLLTYFIKIRGEYEPVIRLIKQAPSMLALLEKALPIISQEAERREDWGERHNAESHQYATEMSHLRDEILAEIDKAYGREAKQDG